MKKRLVLTTVFAMFLGCVVSFADVSPRGDRGPEKPKTVKVDNKRDSKKPAVKPAAKPAPKPAAHKPAPKPNNKPVAHKPSHKPTPKPVAYKPVPKPAPKPVCCNKPVVHHCDPAPVNGFVAGAVTTAAVVGLVAAIVN